MAVTIDATVGGASANSFVLLTTADTYIESRLNSSTWTSATADNKNRALVEATRELSVRGWKGTRANSTQALSWPRQLAVDPDSPSSDYFDTDVIPQRVKDACCELAFQFIKAGTSDIASLDATVGVRRKKVDVIETEYEPHARVRGLARYPRVWSLIEPMLENSSANQFRIVRG